MRDSIQFQATVVYVGLLLASAASARGQAVLFVDRDAPGCQQRHKLARRVHDRAGRPRGGGGRRRHRDSRRPRHLQARSRPEPDSRRPQRDLSASQ